MGEGSERESMCRFVGGDGKERERGQWEGGRRK